MLPLTRIDGHRETVAMRQTFSSVARGRGVAAHIPLAVRYASTGRELARPRQRSADVFSLFDDLLTSPFSFAPLALPRDVFAVDVTETKDAFIVKGDLPGFQTKGAEISTRVLRYDTEAKLCV